MVRNKRWTKIPSPLPFLFPWLYFTASFPTPVPLPLAPVMQQGWGMGLWSLHSIFPLPLLPPPTFPLLQWAAVLQDKPAPVLALLRLWFPQEILTSPCLGSSSCSLMGCRGTPALVPGASPLFFLWPWYSQGCSTHMCPSLLTAGQRFSLSPMWFLRDATSIAAGFGCVLWWGCWETSWNHLELAVSALEQPLCNLIEAPADDTWTPTHSPLHNDLVNIRWLHGSPSASDDKGDLLMAPTWTSRVKGIKEEIPSFSWNKVARIPLVAAVSPGTSAPWAEGGGGGSELSSSRRFVKVLFICLV